MQCGKFTIQMNLDEVVGQQLVMYMWSALATDDLILQVKSIELDEMDLHACPYLARQLP
jgi:hypothetical protein